MENFFYNDDFYSDLNDLIDSLEIDIDRLEEDWSILVEQCSLEKIFTFKEKFITETILEATDTWEDRFPEDSDRTFDKIKEAIKQGIDIEKMNNLLPSLWYPNGKKVTITKKDLIEAS